MEKENGKTGLYLDNIYFPPKRPGSQDINKNVVRIPMETSQDDYKFGYISVKPDDVTIRPQKSSEPRIRGEHGRVYLGDPETTRNVKLIKTDRPYGGPIKTDSMIIKMSNRDILEAYEKSKAKYRECLVDDKKNDREVPFVEETTQSETDTSFEL